MAVRPIQVDVYELITLLASKSNVVGMHLSGCPHPTAIDIDGMGDVIKRMGELHLALKEAIAAMPKPSLPKGQGINVSGNLGN